MLVRADSLRRRMSRYLVDRIEATPNIEVVTGVEVAAVRGDGHLEARRRCASLKGDDAATLDAAAMFIFIGTAPHTEMVAGSGRARRQGLHPDRAGPAEGPGGKPLGWPLERDPFLFETNVPGIFAAGDVRAGSGKRVAAAVGEGSGAVSMVHRYLETV